MQRLGIFGGTFDPVHLGHLRVAVELAECFALTSLRLLPNHRPVHRDSPEATTLQRIAMLELAIKGVPELILDTREAQRETPSYTVHTLQEMQTEFPNAQLVFFMGVDAFAAFDTWYQWETILTLANLVIVDRPGSKVTEVAKQLMDRQQDRHGCTLEDANAGIIVRHSVTHFAISATDIRQRVAAGQTTRFLLTDAVREYIEQRHLYR